MKSSHTSVELKEVNCCASCEYFEMGASTLDSLYSICTLHTVSKYSSLTKMKHDNPIEVEPYNLCKDFTDE
jgi:hypothetical protein